MMLISALVVQSLVFYLSFVARAAPSTVQGTYGTLNVANKVISPDGFQRSSVLVNSQFPGPLISGSKGDTFRLNVINQLSDDTMLRGTSIHWHGIFQKGSNWADGTEGVTQCPIAPEHSFLYQFDVRKQAGTFWYHSHFGTQYCDGLRGPLVIYDPNDPHKSLYDVDDETTIITVGDWYHSPAPSITGLNGADSTLINGLGRYPGGPLAPLAVVNVKHGKRYRFRLLAISCDPNYIFSIDGHRFTVIEADGENTQPVTVDSIQIFAGQRYSIVMVANQPVGNYWIRALPNFGENNLGAGFTNGINSAILRYAGAPNSDPKSTQNTGVMLQETDLHPLKHSAAPGRPFPGGADVNINLDMTANFTTFLFSINGVPFEPPTVPVLLQILSGAKTAQQLLPKGSVYSLPRNKVIEVSIPGGVFGSPHPFHLHGHAFSVVQSAGNNTQPNYLNPVRRDVVSIGDVGSNVTIRFVTDNPGPWFLHCHIDWHLAAGMAVVFAEDSTDVAANDPTPDEWKDLCPIYNSLPASETSARISPPAPT